MGWGLGIGARIYPGVQNEPFPPGIPCKSISEINDDENNQKVNLLFPLYEEGTVFDATWKAIEAQRGVGGHVRWPFPERELLRVGQGIALGLAAMHSKGYSHRDMKPHNVLMYVYLSVNLI